MLHYLTKSVLICIYFQEEKKSENWIKPDSKFLFDFIDILEFLNFTDFGFLILLLNK